jgi:hypothetical protein
VPGSTAHLQRYTSERVSCPAGRRLCIRHCSLLATLIFHCSVSPAVRRVHTSHRPEVLTRRLTSLVAPRLPGRPSLSVALSVVCDMMRSLALIGDTHSPDAQIIADDSTVNGLVGRWVGECTDRAARVPGRLANLQRYTYDGISCPAARCLCIRHRSLLDTLIFPYNVSPACRRVASFTLTSRPHVKINLSCSTVVAWATRPLCGARRYLKYDAITCTHRSYTHSPYALMGR